MGKKEEIISFSEVNMRTPNYYTSTINFTTKPLDRTLGFHKIFKINNLARVRIVAEIKQDCNSLGNVSLCNQDISSFFINSTPFINLKNDDIWMTGVNFNICNYTNGIIDKIINNDTIGINITDVEPTEGKLVFHIWVDALNTTGEIIVY